MLTLKILLLSITAISSFLSGRLDYIISDKQSKLYKISTVALFATILISFITGSIVTIADDISNDKKIKELNDQVRRDVYKIDNFTFNIVVTTPIDADQNGSLFNYKERLFSSEHAPVRSHPALVQPIITSLLPDSISERVAYGSICSVNLILEIFKNNNMAKEFIEESGHKSGQGDLVFNLGKSTNNGLHLGIDFFGNNFWLSGFNLLDIHPVRNTGRIMSLHDLNSATAVIYFQNSWNTTDENEINEMKIIRNKRDLKIFGMNFSNGQRIYFHLEKKFNKHKDCVFVYRFPSTDSEIEKMLE